MSLSREFAAFVAGLAYEDLPQAVIDRAKGVTLEALTSALVAHAMPAGRQALALMLEEEAGSGGAATVLCSGAKLTKAGAAFVNTEIIFAGGKWDTFRMLTHPGTAILPAALAAAETAGASGKTFLTGVAAGYEVMERMAAEFIPTVMARGFHASPVFGIFGAAIAAAKIGGLDAEQIHGTIAQCVNLASGNLEGARSGGRLLRGRCGQERAARRRLGPARHPRRRDGARGRGRLLPRLCRQQPRRVALQLHRRQPRRPRKNHRRPRARLDLSRNPLPDLFDGRLQHRTYRCDGRALRRAWHRP